MGYTYRNHGQIKDFWPDNDSNTYYISCEYGEQNISDIVEQAAIYFNESPEYIINRFKIAAERIHTSCLTYNRYDPSDYTNFIVIRRG